MRRLWATAVSGAIILLSAGCTTDAATTGAATTGAATTGAPAPAAGATSQATAAPGVTAGAADSAGDAALANDTGAVCKQATEVSSQAVTRIKADLKEEAEVSARKDKTAHQRAQAKTGRDVENWGFALSDLSGLVADPAVKKALGEVGKDVTGLKADAKKIDDAKVAAWRKTIDKACGAS